MNLKECPKCGFEGSMSCWKAIRFTGMKCICPNCNHTFGNLRNNKPKKN